MEPKRQRIQRLEAGRTSEEGEEPGEVTRMRGMPQLVPSTEGRMRSKRAITRKIRARKRRVRLTMGREEPRPRRRNLGRRAKSARSLRKWTCLK